RQGLAAAAASGKAETSGFEEDKASRFLPPELGFLVTAPRAQPPPVNYLPSVPFFQTRNRLLQVLGIESGASSAPLDK
ncbi:hypothetical protein P7K49_007103, partial [Saguinus oedipus]